MVTSPRPLAEYFTDLRDPRVALKCRHDFKAVILIVVCATLAGADDFVGMATFARAKRTWFRERLGSNLDNGIPSHDTLNRVFAAIRPDEFGACFLGWVEAMSDGLTLEQIAIDGKAMRGSRRKTGAGYRTVQVVSAWASGNGVTPAQVRTDEKSNEITAIPELLQRLDVSGALVSLDAAGCRKDIATRVVAGRGDYLLAVKDNQPRLFGDIQVMARAALEADYTGLSQCATEEKSHGREEFRFCFAMTDLAGIRDRGVWKGLKSVVCVVRSRLVSGEESSEVQYYISSRRGSGKMFLGASRRHWGIENACHWALDVAFREDDHRLREGHAPENMSLVRKMALAMLKKAEADMGIKNKRLKAGWDDSFLEDVLREFLSK